MRRPIICDRESDSLKNIFERMAIEMGAVAANKDILVALEVCPASKMRILYPEKPKIPAGASHRQWITMSFQ